MFIRRVRTASGATAVQIAEYVGGRQRIVEHVGSAHSEAELGILMARARELLEPPGQDALDLGIEPIPVVRPLLAAPPAQPELFASDHQVHETGLSRASAARVVATDSRVLFHALGSLYSRLGFDVVGDEVFRDLVIARVVEPTSLLDTARVLTDLGRKPASYATMKRTLTRAMATGPGTSTYRDQITELCFAHAVNRGDVSLVLYDVTVRHEALVVRVGVRDHHRGRGRSRGREAGGSLTGETSGRAGAAPTKPWRASTAGWRGRGERAEEVYARNRRHHLS